MSSDSPSPLRPRFGVSPTMRITLLAWLVVAIGGYTLLSGNSANPANVRHDDENTIPKIPADLPNNIDAGNPELLAELEAAREESRRLTERINRLENGVGGSAGNNEQPQVAKSDRAVQKAKLVALTAEVNSATVYLGKLRKLQTGWRALEATLLNGEAGRKISGSPQHLQLVVDLWQRERPSSDRIVQWESELNALSDTISQPASEQATITITDEHAKMLSDLGQELKRQATEFEQQKLLLESIQRETSAMKAVDLTLVEAIEQHRGQQEKAEADRLALVRQTARSQAEKEGADRIAKAERELADDRTKEEERKVEAKKQQLAEEARVAELKHQAELERVKDEAKRVEEDRKWARLEAEMQRDMNEIKGLLMAYTSPGFTYRPDDTKGPVSYSLIKSSGGLEPTRKGLGSLFFIAVGNSDRERGGLPRGVGGTIAQETPIAPIERAQELLIKYGELMVRKEMLAP